MSKSNSWTYKGQSVKIFAGKTINETTYEVALTVPKGLVIFKSFSRRVVRNFIDKFVRA